MKKLLLSTLISIFSLTTVGNAKADLKDEYNNIDYIHQTCKSNYKNKLKTAFWVDRESDDSFAYYQVYNDTVVFVGRIVYHNKESKVWRNYLCNKDVISSMGRLGKVITYSLGGAKYQYELVNNNEKLVRYKKEYGEVERTYFDRCNLVQYCFRSAYW
jgi:hypothetical protein